MKQYFYLVCKKTKNRKLLNDKMAVNIFYCGIFIFYLCNFFQNLLVYKLFKGLTNNNFSFGHKRK